MLKNYTSKRNSKNIFKKLKSNNLSKEEMKNIYSLKMSYKMVLNANKIVSEKNS